MWEIPGYRDLSIIYESANSLVFRARREDDDRPVVLKLLKENYPSPSEYIRYKQEYKITSLLKDLPGIIQTFGMMGYRNTLFIVLEDVGAESLNKWMQNRRFGLREVLTMGARLCDYLGGIHANNVIHKDISPANLIYNPQDEALKIIDFGISSQVSEESPELLRPNILEGNLAYISPEQTGRMNRPIDYRTDFYSLGATLYHLLTGRPPFVSDDPMELVHGHLALPPLPPHQLDKDLPEAVSELVLKLLAKAPEDRYQSVWGLKADLQTCLKQLAESGGVVRFDLGRRDIADRLILPRKLYGRDAEIQTLKERFEWVCQGHKEITLVSGHSGIGKTVLVQELYKPLTLSRGIFIRGKFDLLKREMPYSAFAEAFRQLFRQLLSEPEAQVESVRRKLKAALGPNGRVMSDWLADIELFLGPQPAIEDLTPTERQNRFNLVFQNFVSVFATPEHPLMVFIDDLQWGDTASLKLLHLCMTAPSISCLHFIGAFRSNEVGPTHPLMETLKEIQASGGAVSQVQLSSLETRHVNQLLGDAFRLPPETTLPLAEILAEKTQGNPFFLNEFLHSLWMDELLVLDRQTGCFSWKLQQIRARRISQNVADLLASKLQRLPAATQVVLKVAACLGNQVPLDTLAAVLAESPKALLAKLIPALEAGLLLGSGSAYKAIEHDVSRPDGSTGLEYRFAHDRIQTAAYALMDQQEQQEIHLGVGRFELSRLHKDGNEARIFDVVDHLNLARDRMASEEARIELAGLDLLAGRRAKQSAAFGPSWKYLSAGLLLLPADRWERHRSLTLALTQEAAEAAYLHREFDAAERLTGELIERARDLLDKARAYEILIDAYSSQHKPVEAVRAGLTILGLLGIKFPRHPKKIQVIPYLLQARWALRGQRLEGILDLPQMKDERLEAAVRIARKISMPLFLFNTELWVIFLCISARILLKHGNTMWSGAVFIGLAHVLCHAIGDVDTGYRLSLLSIKLSEKWNGRRLISRVYFLKECFVTHWREHLSNTLKPLLEGYHIGLENGEFEFGAMCGHQYGHHCYYLGRELTQLEQELAAYSADLGRIKQEIPRTYNEIFRQGVLNLQGRSKDPCLLEGEAFDEKLHLPLLLQAKNNTGLVAVYYNNMLLNFLFRRFATALSYADRAAEIESAVTGLFGATRLTFLDSLCRLMVYAEASGRMRRRIWKRVARNQRKLRKLARHAPMNHLHVYELVEAERRRVQGRHAQAGAHYRRAMASARENGYVNEEAIACELAGNHCLSQNRLTEAKGYLSEARYAYLKWGAMAKVQDVDVCHGVLLAGENPFREERKADGVGATVALTATGSAASSSSGHTTSTPSGNLLDLGSVLKASQSISGEIEFDRLVDRLMRVALENAGAEKAILVIHEEGAFRVEACLDVALSNQTRLVSKSVDEFTGFASAIVRYVIRSRQELVLDNAVEHRDFQSDPYVIAHRPKSILCLPILRHTALIAVLYLENNKAASVFTPERVRVLELLASQVAISLENARLYQKLQQALSASRESSRVKNEFLARVSHELRTPLNAIINIPEGILEEYGACLQARCSVCQGLFTYDAHDQLDEQLACPRCGEKGTVGEEPAVAIESQDIKHILRCQDIIMKSGRRLLYVLNDLIDISELEAGTIMLQPGPVLLMDLMREIKGSIGPETHDGRICVVFQNVEEDSEVLADRTRLKQALLHLLENAIKFSPADKEIVVRVSRVEDEVLFSIKDQGIGIATEHQQMIFEGFRQIDEISIRRYGGTGIGLAIARKLVELHHGELWVESGAGQGSTFHIKLPSLHG